MRAVFMFVRAAGALAVDPAGAVADNRGSTSRPAAGRFRRTTEPRAARKER
jgi:hypothetical protein